MNSVVVVTLISILLAVAIRWIPRAKISNHLIGHAAVIKSNLILHDIAAELRQMLINMKEVPSVLDQATGSGTVPVHEQIGEGVALNADGTCSHDYLFPKHDKTLCILPQRVDVGR